MNNQTNQSASTDTPAEDPELKQINAHLDALLGVDARKPGAAAHLPAVIRITETLEAAGGKEFPVFPPSYANKGYDLNGIEYGQVLQEKSSKDTKRNERQIIRARHCTMDSPQSHANRTEIAFRDDEELRSLVPEVYSVIPRKEEFADQSRTDVLALPHRVADFRVRASKQADVAKAAISALAKGDALLLLRLMPTSIVFGFWDSRADGYQHKHSRILLSRIDAFNVIPCERHALYSGPYSKDECALVVLGDATLSSELTGLDEAAGTKGDEEKDKASKDAKAWADAMASRGASNALGSGLGGVIVEGEIKRLALISLTDIASIFCRKPDVAPPAKESAAVPEKKTSDPAPNPTPAIDLDLTNAARRYLLALALLAENFPRSKGSYRLRSGCELLPVPSAGKKDAKETILMGAGAESEAAKALIALCGDRALLIKVAADAATKLGIVKLLPDFDSDIASLKADLTKGNKSAKAADNDIKKLRKAAKDATDKAATARKKATLAQEAATAARTKANGSNKDRDLTAATNKEETAKRLLLDAGEAEKVAKEAAAQLPDAAPADPQPELPKEPASTDESPAEGNSESGEQKI